MVRGGLGTNLAFTPTRRPLCVCPRSRDAPQTGDSASIFPASVLARDGNCPVVQDAAIGELRDHRAGQSVYGERRERKPSRGGCGPSGGKSSGRSMLEVLRGSDISGCSGSARNVSQWDFFGGFCGAPSREGLRDLRPRTHATAKRHDARTSEDTAGHEGLVWR